MSADRELLDEEGRKRRDHWLSLFVHHPDAPGEVEPEPELAAIQGHYPDLWNERIAPFFAELYATTGLEPKTVELISAALMALRGWETGVRAHTTLALNAGATPEEVRGAILITLGTGGVTAAARGLAWAEPLLVAHEGEAVG
jgi:4-carboxymuconolactone decarboxylase